ncbi:MAG TPA: phosphatase PAP2 family protein [bacterium]|nr:phosphatase PAP2 family protein [bacterium]
MRRFGRTLSIAVLLLLFGPGRAGAASRDDVRDLRGQDAIDLPLSLGLGVGWIGSEAEKKHFAPSECHWCDSVPWVDERARDAWKWSDPQKADTASNVADFVGMPVLMLGMDALLASEHGALDRAPHDALFIVEAVVAASALNQAIKFSVGRERPFVHALSPDQKPLTAQPSDNNVSFYSGHTTLAFTLATATGTVATLRGYKHAWAVWPVGLTAAAAVGYLRIGADKHYFTDVATGAVLGSAIGVGMPLLMHGRKDGTAAFSASATASPVGGPHVVVAFAF